jgi:phage-related protein
MAFSVRSQLFAETAHAKRPLISASPVKIDDGDTHRAIYTVRFAQAVYVLHVFQKESPRGIETEQSDVALVRERLKVAQQSYEERYG